ncbi:MAG: radical SAM protein [Candidatus Omnitrophota bacterium]
MIKVLVLNPPSPSSVNVIRDQIYGCWCKGKRIGGASTPPYPLVQIATVLKERGIAVKVIDALGEKIALNELKRDIAQFDILVVLTSVMTFSEDAQVLRYLKQVHRNIRTVICGALPTFMPEFCLKQEEVDIIVRREPEFVIRDLVDALEKKEPWQNIPGIGYRENGKVVLNADYPLIENLDELPLLNWSLLSKKARYFNPLIRRYPYVTDQTTRGCPERCSFCMSPGFYGRRVRSRSAENVIAGFKKHVREGYKEVYLRDEMFTTFKARNKEICERMIKEHLDLNWICAARVDSLNYEMMSLMKKAGCHAIKFGVESGVQSILDAAKKRITLKQTEDSFRWANQLGIHSHAHVMLGLPGENKQTINQTIDFLKKINPTTATFGIVMPFPGTELFEMVAKNYPEIKDGFALDLKMLHSSSFFTHTFCDLSAKELAYYIKKMHRDFYWRLPYLWQWLMRLRNIADLKRVFKAGMKIVDFSIRGDE